MKHYDQKTVETFPSPFECLSCHQMGAIHLYWCTSWSYISSTWSSIISDPKYALYLYYIHIDYLVFLYRNLVISMHKMLLLKVPCCLFLPAPGLLEAHGKQQNPFVFYSWKKIIMVSHIQIVEMKGSF
jgi:hypothetical protein